MKHLLASVIAFSGLLASPSLADDVPFSDPRWQFSGAETEVVTIGGREALLIFNGRAELPDAGFENGVIEYDVRVAPERGFHGVHFRMFEEGQAEEFYIRPHQSGMEDANQYTPIFNGLPGWQLYFGPQFSAPTEYHFGQWMHIKLVVSGDLMDVYIDSEQPVLSARLKNRRTGGGLALSSFLSPTFYANFRFERWDIPEIIGTPAPADPPPPGTVTAWEVSSPFAEAALEGVITLADEHLEGLSWQTLAVEDRGYANLARVSEFGEGSDTVFARLRISAEEDAVRTLRFGYSDRVKVYLNGELVYAGDNGYRSRDYRYLGTIGLFDEIPLRLEAGENEVLLAVSESFGGWGVMAQIENREGLMLNSAE